MVELDKEDKTTLDMDRADLEKHCKNCDLGKLRPKEADLTVYCLESNVSKVKC